jgi:hypothetical protein
MVLYPAEYRREHESEILGTLLEAAGSGRDRPSLRECVALLCGGLRTRSRLAAASPGRLGADGLHLGVLLFLVLACGVGLRVLLGPVVFPGRMGIAGDADLAYLQWAMLAIGLVASAWGRAQIGLAAVAGFVAIQEIALHGVVARIPVVPVNWVVVAALLAALAWHPRFRALHRPRSARSALLALGGAGLMTAISLAVDAAAMQRPGLPLALIAASPQLVLPVAGLLVLAVAGTDPRPALAAAVYVLATVAGLAQVGFSIPLVGFEATEYWLTLLVSAGAAAAALAVAALSARRLAAL